MHEQGLEEKENEGRRAVDKHSDEGRRGGCGPTMLRRRSVRPMRRPTPSGKATRVEGVRKGPVAGQREHTGAMDTATLVVNPPLAGWVERLARGLSRLRPAKEPAASGSA